jgi:hypothetical protein
MNRVKIKLIAASKKIKITNTKIEQIYNFYKNSTDQNQNIIFDFYKVNRKHFFAIFDTENAQIAIFQINELTQKEQNEAFFITNQIYTDLAKVLNSNPKFKVTKPTFRFLGSSRSEHKTLNLFDLQDEFIKIELVGKNKYFKMKNYQIPEQQYLFDLQIFEKIDYYRPKFKRNKNE